MSEPDQWTGEPSEPFDYSDYRTDRKSTGEGLPTPNDIFHAIYEYQFDFPDHFTGYSKDVGELLACYFDFPSKDVPPDVCDRAKIAWQALFDCELEDSIESTDWELWFIRAVYWAAIKRSTAWLKDYCLEDFTPAELEQARVFLDKLRSNR